MELYIPGGLDEVVWCASFQDKPPSFGHDAFSSPAGAFRDVFEVDFPRRASLSISGPPKRSRLMYERSILTKELQMDCEDVDLLGLCLPIYRYIA